MSFLDGIIQAVSNSRFPLPKRGNTPRPPVQRQPWDERMPDGRTIEETVGGSDFIFGPPNAGRNTQEYRVTDTPNGRPILDFRLSDEQPPGQSALGNQGYFSTPSGAIASPANLSGLQPQSPAFASPVPLSPAEQAEQALLDLAAQGHKRAKGILDTWEPRLEEAYKGFTEKAPEIVKPETNVVEQIASFFAGQGVQDPGTLGRIQNIPNTLAQGRADQTNLANQHAFSSRQDQLRQQAQTASHMIGGAWDAESAADRVEATVHQGRIARSIKENMGQFRRNEKLGELLLKLGGEGKLADPAILSHSLVLYGMAEAEEAPAMAASILKDVEENPSAWLGIQNAKATNEKLRIDNKQIKDDEDALQHMEKLNPYQLYSTIGRLQAAGRLPQNVDPGKIAQEMSLTAQNMKARTEDIGVDNKRDDEKVKEQKRQFNQMFGLRESEFTDRAARGWADYHLDLQKFNYSKEHGDGDGAIKFKRSAIGKLDSTILDLERELETLVGEKEGGSFDINIDAKIAGTRRALQQARTQKRKLIGSRGNSEPVKGSRTGAVMELAQ